MSFGGSVAQMIQSIRNNNALLQKKTAFIQLKKYEERKLNYKLKFVDKKISPFELERIKTQIRKDFLAERKRNNIIVVTVLVSVFVVLGWSVNYMFFTPSPKVVVIDVEAEKESSKQFYFYINDGYRRLKNNEFHNAIYQFELATKARPDDFKANLGLTLALIKKCAITKEDCDKANNQQILLLTQFPEKQQEIENEIVVLDEAFNEVLSDSIVFSPKLHNNLSFISSKKNKTSAFILNENGDTLLITNLIKEKKNIIEIDKLKKGIYIIEMYDINGLLMRTKFVKK